MMGKYLLVFFWFVVVFLTPVVGNCAGFEADEVKYNLGLFGDINYATNSREKKHNSFFLGETDLYATASYGRMNFLGELVVEFEPEETALDFERLWLGYNFSDQIVARAGKHHTSLGYWNHTYHHGKQLFTTIDRPFIIAFEDGGGVLPMHITGIEFEGKFFMEDVNLRYEFQIGNGPGISSSGNTLKNNTAEDDNGSKQWIARISASPAILPRFIVGVSGTSYNISRAGANQIAENVIGIDLSYNADGLELLGEYYRMWNSDNSADLFYVQTGYYIPKFLLTPYIRYESMYVDDGDSYMIALGGRKDRAQEILGVRYDLNERSSLKAQYRRDDENGSDVKNVFEVQWAFHF